MLLFTLALPWSVLRAEVVADIDAARIPVPDRSETTRNSARRDGMEQVLVKLSGSRATLDSPQVQSALRDSRRYLLRYSYEDAGDDSVVLRLEYDGRALRRLLRDAGEPLWTANRPTVLAWLVVGDGERRRFASDEADPAARAALEDAFATRGVPLQQPLYDLEDLGQLSPGAAWRQSSAALTSAAARYPETELLAGRAAELADGRMLGEWRFLDRGSWLRRQVEAEDLQAFSRAGADLAAAALAARYAVAGGGSDELAIVLRVEGVTSYAQFSALREVLEGMEAVERLVPQRLSAREVLLSVESAATPSQLARIIGLDGRFSELPAVDDAQLNYRWEAGG